MGKSRFPDILPYPPAFRRAAPLSGPGGLASQSMVSTTGKCQTCIPKAPASRKQDSAGMKQQASKGEDREVVLLMFFRCLLDVYRNWHWIWVTWFTSSWSSDIIWHLTIGSPNAVGLRSSVENCNIGSRCFLLKTKTIDLHPPSSTIIQCQSGCLNSMGFQLTFLRFFQCCVWADGPSGLHRTVKQRPPKRAPWRGPSQRMEWYEYIYMYVCIYIYVYEWCGRESHLACFIMSLILSPMILWCLCEFIAEHAPIACGEVGVTLQCWLQIDHVFGLLARTFAYHLWAVSS